MRDLRLKTSARLAAPSHCHGARVHWHREPEAGPGLPGDGGPSESSADDSDAFEDPLTS